MKKILIPNGNYTDIPLIKELKKLGLYVITSGNAPELEGHKYADEYVQHDYSDREGMLQIAREKQIDYVAANSNDIGVVTAAYIAENLGLVGHDTYENARIIAEKDKFKKFAQENNLQVIPSKGFDDYQKALDYATSLEMPIIIKPTDLAGGKGVTKISSKNQIEEALSKAFNISLSSHVVIEPFIEGSQHSITTFLVNQKVVTYAAYNEYDAEFNPFLVGYSTMPAKKIDIVAPILIDQIEKIASLLGLVDGIFHVQYRMQGDTPLIMECMRRCLGNYSLYEMSRSLGFSIEEWIAKSYCGLSCATIPHVMGNKDRYQSH